MSNIRRYFEHNRPFFITSVTEKRIPHFQKSEICKKFLIHIENLKPKFNFTVQAFCLMPDHIHLLITANGPHTFPHIMQMIKGGFSRELNCAANNERFFWQKRYYDEGIRTDLQLHSIIDYIHHNPVEDGLCKYPGDYPYSSYGQYFGEKKWEVLLKVTPMF